MIANKVSNQLAKKKVCASSILWARGKTLEECWNNMPYAHWYLQLIKEFKMLPTQQIYHILSLMIVYLEDPEVDDYLELIKSEEHNFCIQQLRIIFMENEKYNHSAKMIIKTYIKYDKLLNKELQT